MKKAVPSIGQEELAILQFIQSGEPVTVREVADHFAESGKARTTVLTTMERLRAKELLERRKVGGAFRYHAKLETNTVQSALIGDFIQRVLGGSLTPFVAYLSEADELSESELAELKKLVGRMGRKSKEKT